MIVIVFVAISLLIILTLYFMFLQGKSRKKDWVLEDREQEEAIRKWNETRKN